MSKQLRQGLAAAIVVLLSAFAVSACDSDFWWSMSTIEGRWRIVEVTPYRGTCPFDWDDCLEFQPDGDFYVWYSGAYDSEYGQWGYGDEAVRIDFNGDGWDDLVAYVRQFEDGYMVLDVDDYDFSSQYTLRLLRYD